MNTSPGLTVKVHFDQTVIITFLSEEKSFGQHEKCIFFCLRVELSS